MSETPETDTPIAAWEDVTLTLLYQDGRNVASQEIHLVRSEVEADEKAAARAKAHQAYAEGDERIKDVLEEIDSWTMTPEDFQDRIIRNAQRMVTSPIQLPGAAPHEYKILPPWASRGVVISVNNLASKIVRA